MNGAFYVGSIGLQAQQRALDIIANNIANINTAGFKRADVRFSDVMATRAAADARHADPLDAALSSAGVTVDSTAMVNEAGAIETTGHPMDMAIDGQGFVELMGPSGQTLLWRGGTMKVGEDGLLAASNGMALKAAISIPADASAVTIGSDGMVRAQTADSTTPVELGQIGLVRVDDPSTLTRLDGGLYRADQDAKVLDAQAGEDGTGMLVQGGIERSNVEMTSEMVQLMLVQRAYGANAQILQAADQMMAIANGLRR
ncbi:flagellar basal-body rod protein FlgG [Sphingomonas oligophenolica]|uniref:Flagellar hook-basal body protein n=1 Tax=Sphingomonas oligophenolica TaxID=301154 RepID=A0ABU9Y3Y9_9SPHN